MAYFFRLLVMPDDGFDRCVAIVDDLLKNENETVEDAS